MESPGISEDRAHSLNIYFSNIFREKKVATVQVKNLVGFFFWEIKGNEWNFLQIIELNFKSLGLFNAEKQQL